MKKLILILALLLTTVSFANETQKKEFNVFKTQKTEIHEINNKCIDKDLGCTYTTTTIFYRAVLTKVLSMDSSQTVYEVSYIIDSICTTCYMMGYNGVTTTTNCN